MRDKKGFTLVELLLVVAILAFLIAIIVIAAANISEDSKKKSMYSSLKSVKTALETYYIKYGKFPEDASLAKLVDTVPSDQRIIDAIPTDIFNATPNTAVDYSLNANNRTYVSWSVGPDGDPGITAAGADAITGGPEDDVYVTNAKNSMYKP